MHWFTQLFLILAVVTTLFKLWLDQRHIGHVLRHREKVPQPFDGSVSLAEHQKAADYTAANNRLGLLDTVLDTALLILWTLGGGLALLDSFWGRFDFGPILIGTAVIVSLMVIGSILSLPISLYKTFNLEARFGFNRTTPKLFVVDLIKGLVLTLLIGAPLIAVILWIMDAAGERWWFYAWVVWTVFTLLITWAYPAFIAPWFNEFTPLEQPTLKKRIENLLSRCGFTSNGIFVMDGSKRSSHGNAYFTGLGNNKRIVFFDTLVETLEEDEIEAVLAHELGHFKKNHVKKRLIFVFL
ncbi:MAG: M48 family metallopeptidase, partial [Pseudomonadota bacterium]